MVCQFTVFMHNPPPWRRVSRGTPLPRIMFVQTLKSYRKVSCNTEQNCAFTKKGASIPELRDSFCRCEPSARSEVQNLLRVVSAARQLLCPDVSVFDQTDRTPVGNVNSYVRHEAHARQFTRPNWERLSRISARYVAAVAFCLLR